jgi:hypothetical protein
LGDLSQRANTFVAGTYSNGQPLYLGTAKGCSDPNGCNDPNLECSLGTAQPARIDMTSGWATFNCEGGEIDDNGAVTYLERNDRLTWVPVCLIEDDQSLVLIKNDVWSFHIGRITVNTTGTPYQQIGKIYVSNGKSGFYYIGSDGSQQTTNDYEVLLCDGPVA